MSTVRPPPGRFRCANWKPDTQDTLMIPIVVTIARKRKRCGYACTLMKTLSSAVKDAARARRDTKMLRRLDAERLPAVSVNVDM